MEDRGFRTHWGETAAKNALDSASLLNVAARRITFGLIQVVALYIEDSIKTRAIVFKRVPIAPQTIPGTRICIFAGVRSLPNVLRITR